MQADKIRELKGLMMSEAALVEKMVSLTINGIYSVGSTFLEEVMIFEQRVNQIELELENKCTTAIALYQPEAKDLRVILMIYKINNDLERLGDQAVNIAESAAHLIGDPVLRELPELKEMTAASMTMLQNSLNAFVNEDVEASHEVCNMDNVVDDLNRSIYKQAVVLMKEHPTRIDSYMHLLRIARNLERIGDLSTNIAENTIYLSAGRVIKHNLEEQPE